jgi:hypothetical protein
MPLPLEFSIVTARNLGLEKKARVPTNTSIENFLLKTMDIYGLNYSDIVNIALEKYLIEYGYLTTETLSVIDSVSILEKEIFNKKLL